MKPKELPASADGLGPAYRGPQSDAEKIEWLQGRVAALERELAGAAQRYDKLNEMYTKLADIWNAFQATTKPANRDVHRAEEAGEFARKLAEMLIRLAYGTGKWADLLYVLNSMSEPTDAPRLPGR